MTDKAVFAFQFTTCYEHDDCVKDPIVLQRYFDSFYIAVGYMARKVDYSIYGDKPSRYVTESLFTT